MGNWERCLNDAADYLGLNLPAGTNEAAGVLDPEDAGRLEILARRFQVAAAQRQWWMWECSSGECGTLDPSTPEWWIAAALAVRAARCRLDAKIVLRMGLALHRGHPEISYHLAALLCSEGHFPEASDLLLFAVRQDPTLFDRALVEEDFRTLREQ